MPALGQTTDELRITGWLKHAGDAVRQGEPLFEVETDKATLEVEAFAAGILLKIVQPAESVVAVGSLVAYIGASDDIVPATAEMVAPLKPSAAAPAVVATPQGRTQPGKVLASPAVR